MKTTDEILKNLRAHSFELEKIQRLYVAASRKINDLFFCEEYTTSSKSSQGELATAGSGDRDAITVVLHAKHRNLVRFSTKEEDNYQTVIHYIKENASNALEEVKKKWITEDIYRGASKGHCTSEKTLQPKPRPSVSRTYVERKELKSRITECLLPGAQLKRQPRCILHGLGGAGKTQLATSWIQEHEARFSRVIVVDASTTAQLETDLERSIRSLGTDYCNSTWEDAVMHLNVDQKGWLLFLDNADSSDLELDPYLPTSIHGTVLITTRNSGCAAYAPDSSILVGGLEAREAMDLLHTTANVYPTSDADSLQIVTELGMLALAIAQAGTYIRKTRRLDTYLTTFRTHRNQLLRKQSKIGTEYTSSTYTAFDLSFRGLPTKTQDFLRLFAFLHHSLIPIALFERSTMSGFTTYKVLKSYSPPGSDKTFALKLQEILGQTWNEVAFQEIVDSASGASFIDVSPDGLFYTVHPLLQMYIKDSFSKEEKDCFMRTAAQLLLGAIWPLEGSNALFWQLLPHTNSIIRAIEPENVAHLLAFHELYNSLGDWKACRELLVSAFSEVERSRGERHKDCMWLMGNLAHALRNCGRLDEAEKMQRRLLELQFEVVGTRHLNNIGIMNNLAAICASRGHLGEAEDIYRKVLDLAGDILGQRHPDTVMAMSNLATILCNRGQLDKAEQIQRQVLALRVITLGQQHVDSIVAKNNLACTLVGRGQLEEAQNMWGDIVPLQLGIRGIRHPETIISMSDFPYEFRHGGHFGNCREMQQKARALQFLTLDRLHPGAIVASSGYNCLLRNHCQPYKADKMRQEAITLQLEIHSQQYPDPIASMNNLACTLADRGQLEEAERMRRQVLIMQHQMRGKEHPDTIKTMNNLACTLSDRGQLEVAETMQREALALGCKLLGERNLVTIAIMNNIACIFHDRDQLDKAEGMQQRVLALRLDISGQRHPTTIAAMHNLAITLHSRSQLEEAEKIQLEVLALQHEICGQRHPDTITAMNNLAVTLHSRGRLDEAEKIQREVQALRRDILGQRHPDFITATKNLEYILSSRSQVDEEATKETTESHSISA
ncbi:SubName: Full=Related to kinesin light chain {ECO:0000313/EMBL:CCA74551.1} [Serendipita indica DSM 11827]|nr:SubName: Full=Related to kinesin light chain {ECO:0000313/EMBL:CCA74551.1} [Serendipita indica DSM 11827]